MAQATGQQKFQISRSLNPNSSTKSSTPKSRSKKSADGQVNKLILHQNGRDQPGIKAPTADVPKKDVPKK